MVRVPRAWPLALALAACASPELDAVPDPDGPPTVPPGDTARTSTADTGPEAPPTGTPAATGDTAAPEPLGVCGDAWPLHDHGAAPLFATTFTTRPDDLEQASCGPGEPGSEVVVDFVPPAGGLWWLQAHADGVRTRLSLRADCADPASESACRDQATELHDSEIFADLGAGVPVSLLVERRVGLAPVDVEVRAERVADRPAPPALTAPEARCGDDDRVFVDALIEPGDRPVDRVAVRALDASGAALCSSTSSHSAWPAGVDCAGEVASVELEAFDTLDQSSGIASASCTSPPIRTLDSPCDPRGYADRCDLGVCTGDPAVCAVVTPPTLSDASAFARLDARRLAVAVAGEDPDLDVALVEIELLDATLQPVEVGEAPYPRLSLPLTTGAASFVTEVKASLPPSAPLATTHALSVRLLDEAAQPSDPLVAVIREPETLGDGATCDPFETRDACPAPTACRPVDPVDVFGAHACGPVDAACPPPVAAVLATPEPGDPDVATASVVPGATVVPPPSCADTADQALFAFEAPSAGAWRFGIGGGATWWGLRTTCGIQALDTELDCLVAPDGAAGTPLSLAEGATVYVVAGGAPTDSPLTLTVTRESP